MSAEQTQKDTEIQKQETRLPEGVERTREGKVFAPATDITETEEAITLVADMPGVPADGVDVTLEADLLTIRGTVRGEEPEDAELVWAEYEQGDYQRSFTVSDEIDREGISANISGGVLTLTLPKARPSRKRIEVQAT
jgi:HSP20 family molecular chaperone IbpA